MAGSLPQRSSASLDYRLTVQYATYMERWAGWVAGSIHLADAMRV
jgi:hypothetical protein